MPIDGLNSSSSEKEMRAAIESLFETLGIDDHGRPEIASELDKIVEVAAGTASTEALKERLELLYEHEKKHLELLKEHKEEIKFAHTLQEDLRRERSQFFAQTLEQVAATLSQAQVGEEVAAEWLAELVHTYTASLNTSARLGRTDALGRLGHLHKQRDKAAGAVEKAMHEASTQTDNDSRQNES